MSSWTLHRLTDPSAACLDGLPGAFYHRHSSEARGRWLIYIQGGGWCFSDDDCALRAASSLGSAERLPPQPSAPELTAGGVLSADCAHNAEFCKYNAAILHYCDGGSFSGNASATAPQRRHGVRVPVDDGRGRLRAGVAPPSTRHAGVALLAGALAQLATLGLADATDVLLAGCSAGGLAALLHAAAVRDAVRRSGAPLRRFGVVSFSGMFGLAAPSATTAAHLRAITSRVGRPAGCAAAEDWRCWAGTAPLEALPADLPAFVEQSTLDRWVSYCEFGADTFSGHYLRNCAAGEWANCLQFTRPFAHGRLGRKCTDAQRAQIEAHQRAAADALRATTALRRPKYGGFVHGCHDHCPATRSGSWEHTKVGDVALADAVRRWWAGDATVHDPGCIADFAGGCAPSCWGLQPWPDPRPLVERQIKALGGAARGGRRARRLRREDSSG